MTDSRWIDISFTSRDGLRLHGRHYQAGGSGRRPVLCLPGLTRNGRDFHDLALTLSDARGHRRDVYTLDSRGRGLSDYDPEWRNYAITVEAGDALDFLAMLDISGAAVIGTSRGGLVAMALAAMRPGAIGAFVLNDIGPVIERNGLARIIAQVGRFPVPTDWDEAARFVLALNTEHFPRLTLADAAVLSKQWLNENNGRPAPGYDPKLAMALSLPDGPLPHMWAQFEALSLIPGLVLKGANSDILTTTTVEEMAMRHPALRTLVVPNEGHAPLLRDQPTQSIIQQFLLDTDAASFAH